MIEKIFITRGNEFSKFELKNKLITSENKKKYKKIDNFIIKRKIFFFILMIKLIVKKSIKILIIKFPRIRLREINIKLKNITCHYFLLNCNCLLNFLSLIGCGGTDLNRRPSGYEPDELPDCSTPRYNYILFLSLLSFFTLLIFSCRILFFFLKVFRKYFLV